MKKLLTYLTFAFVAVFASNMYAQNCVITDTTSNQTSCDGAAFMDSNIVFNNTVWYGGGVVLQTGGASISNLCAGTYTVSFTDGTGNNVTCTFTIGSGSTNPCSGFTANVTTTNATSAILCDGTAVAFSSGGTAPYTYLWGNGVSSISQTGLCPGAYTCTVTDANGCTANATEIINSTSQNILTVVDASNPTMCDGAAYIDSNSVVNNPVWSFGGNIVAIGGLVLNNLCPGTYQLTYNDYLGNPVSNTFVITGNSNPCGGFSSISNTMNATNSSVCDGSSFFDVWGGTLPYSFQWSNGATTYYSNNLCVGTYTCTITDQNGCSITSSVTIMDTSSLLCNNISVNITSTDATNASSCDGIAVADGIGGTAPYSYLWGNGTTAASQSGLCVGTYDCIVTDSNGCVVSGTVVVNDASTVIDSILIFNNISFPGANVIDSLTTVSIEDCSIDYSLVVSASITNSVPIGTDSLQVTWTLFAANGTIISTYTVNYLVVNPTTGVYSATLIVFCSQKSTNYNTIEITDQVYMQSAGLAAIDENTITVVNPFSNEIQISFGESVNASVVLMDMNGRILSENSIDNANNLTIESSNLSQGTYLLQVNIAGRVNTYKLMK